MLTLCLLACDHFAGAQATNPAPPCDCASLNAQFKLTLNTVYGMTWLDGQRVEPWTTPPLQPLTPASGLLTVYPEERRRVPTTGFLYVTPDIWQNWSYGVSHAEARALYEDHGCRIKITVKMLNANGDTVKTSSTPPGQFVGMTMGATSDMTRLMMQRGASINNKSTTFPTSGTFVTQVNTGNFDCPEDAVKFQL